MANLVITSQAAPNLDITQLEAFDDIQPWDYLNMLKRIIVPDITRAAYAMTASPDADDVVFNHRAFHKYRKLFRALGITLVPIVMTDAHHADTMRCQQESADWMRGAIYNTEKVIAEHTHNALARVATTPAPQITRRNLIIGRR